MKIKLPDGAIKEFNAPVTPREVAQSISDGLARATVGARVNGELVDADRPIETDAALNLVTKPRKNTPVDQQDPDALYLLRHSCAHVMAEAIQSIWPEAQLAYGPPLDNGFYYDIRLDQPISSDDFEKIEDKMAEIVKEDRPFTRVELPKQVGLKWLAAEDNKYKVDNANRAIQAGSALLSWYFTGDPARDKDAPEELAEYGLECVEEPDWSDLCMGPHVPSTGAIGAFKLTSVAQSHWHGDVNQDAFQRVYGTAFFTKRDLEDYLQRLEEARQRDHRVIGQKLGLFTIDEQVGQGLVLWKPRGAMVRNLLEDFLKQKLLEAGYELVYTPHIGKIDLYQTSGHYPYYEASQFPQIRQVRDETRPLLIYLRQVRDGQTNLDRTKEQTLVKQAEMESVYPFDEKKIRTKLAVVRYYAQSGENYLLRPMNCPHHCRIYGSDMHSYRDLPIRLAEFGTVYRWEQSGELTGMTRVRGFTQDDAHVFCTPDQVKDEVRQCIELVQFVFNSLGFENVSIYLSLRDPAGDKYVGDPRDWDRAERELRELLDEMDFDYVTEEGEAAFYGPKVDFKVKDVIGREWQLGTVQLDYNLPKRFELSYVGKDNQPHQPVMIHRAPFGSMERFMGILIEHYAGAFPLWLSPEQMRVLTISEKFTGYGQTVTAKLRAAGFRATLDDSDERVNAKVRIAQDMKVNYMLVVGGRDEQAGTVSVRDRTRGDLGAMPLDQFIDQAGTEQQTRGKQIVGQASIAS